MKPVKNLVSEPIPEGPSPLARGSRVFCDRADVVGGSIPARAGQPRPLRLLLRYFWVHPRSRGAACGVFAKSTSRAGPSRSRGAATMKNSTRWSQWGPSPLTRGSRDLEQSQTSAIESIPARAGQPIGGANTELLARVHPRSRGAAMGAVGCTWPLSGPSPLARGSPNGVPRLFAQSGSIPARAGQPRANLASHSLNRVHPRSRGAAQRGGFEPGCAVGPSPLARGSPAQGGAVEHALGSIPARAGQPGVTRQKLRNPGVHPRSRGAALVWDGVPRVDSGPSPLARGSHQRRVLSPSAGRSIPARAGQPAAPRSDTSSIGVHPRSRGAAVKTLPDMSMQKGPSPLARGSLRRHPLLR